MSITERHGLTSDCMHSHSNKTGKAGLALISIGNPLRSDDGVAEAVCARLPAQMLGKVCHFNLGTHTGHLINCLQRHQAAIVLDATSSGKEPGSCTIVDLAEAVRSDSPLKLHFSHGLSFMDELRLARRRGLLPPELIFVGIEAASCDWGDQLSDSLIEKIPELVFEIEKIIGSLLEEESQGCTRRQ